MLKKTIKNTFVGIIAVATTAFIMTPVYAGGHLPGEGKTVRPVEGTNLEEKFQHKILYRALKDLGYKIAEPDEVNYQTIHIALGTGDSDFTAVHWDPLHAAFFKEAGGKKVMSKVGDYIQGALQGYLVDKKSFDAGVKNLGDLKKAEIAKRFDHDGDGKADLAGCPPGWGCERVIEHHMGEFGMRTTVTHNQGDYNAVIADIIAAYNTGKHVIYYTWTPYWVSGVLVPGKDVEWIEVPYSSLPDGRKGMTKFNGKEVGFEVNSIRVVANNAFLKNNPAAERLFEIAVLDINDVSGQNKKMRDGEDSIKDIDRHVNEWIRNNQNTYNFWLSQAKSAAK